MKKRLTCFLAFVIMSLQPIFAQNLLVPSDNVFEKKWITSGKSEFAYFYYNNNSPLEIGTFVVETNVDNNNLDVYTQLSLFVGTDTWKDTSISTLKDFSPVYRSSFNKDKEFVIKFGKTATGYYLDKKTKKKTTINENNTANYFESYTYPYLLSALPLTTGYKKDISVYDYKIGDASSTKKSSIQETKSNIYISNITGEHKVWEVTVLEIESNESFIYTIDKENKKLYKIEIFSNGQHILLVSRETDFNPIKSTFNKTETLKMIKDGNSVIMGQAFARDNQGAIKGMAILNVNKKQFAAQGTGVILIPKTDYFKEWKEVNEYLQKKKKPGVPLPKEVRDCIKTTTIYDDEGHFEFTNLLPGEYLLFTQFGYVHTATAREVIGYTDTYIGGNYQGTTENTRSYSYGTNASASVEKTVTIKENGDKVSVKLKKTR